MIVDANGSPVANRDIGSSMDQVSTIHSLQGTSLLHGLTSGEYFEYLGLMGGMSGLGDTQSASGAVNTAGTAASATTSVLAATGTIAASTAAIAIPVVGAVVAGLIFWLNRKGPQQKIETTKIVNDAEPILKQNLAAWQSLPASQKTVSVQKQMLDNFNQVWQRVVQLCSDSKYGDPGHNCINDRNRGGKWDWFSYYYDPIANDPGVIPDTPVSVTGNVVNSVVSGAMSGNLMMLLLLGVGVIAVLDVME